MTGKSLLIASALAIAGALAPQVSSAASLAPQSTWREVQNENPLLQKTQWAYCRNWRNVCADRHGWRTRDYFRCLERHGC
jgi:hypothetical protein